MVITVALATASGTLSESASAGLYKCELDSGITYQQTPCPPGRELRNFDRNPATVSVVPFQIAPEDKTRRTAPAPDTHAPDAHAPAKARPSKSAVARGKAAERKFLIPGIYQGEVLARVGSPDLKSGSGRRAMRWTYLPAPDDPSTVTTLTFNEGRLIEVERKVVHSQ